MTVAADTSSMAEVLDRGRSLRIELSAGERWWGGRVVDGHHGPYGDRPFEADLGSCGGNQVAALLCSNRGRVLHSATPFRVRFDGADTLEASLGDEVATLRPDAEVTLVAAGENLRDAFGYARSEVFEPDGETPAELMFTAPQYALWIEQMYVPTQEGVLRYADALLEAGFPPGVLIIDDGWSVGYGEPVFRLDRFPDPDAMVAWLHERGFKLMLWVCPLVGPNGMPFLDLQKRGLLLRDADGETIVRRWWNGHAAVFDMTSRESVEAFLNPLRVLRERHGIDGFKMDAGDTRQYRIGDAAALPGALPADQAHAFAKLGLEFSYAEVKAGFNNGGLGVASRLRDKHHDWTAETGVNAIVPHALAASMIGTPFYAPDMIGGGEWIQFTERIDSLEPELFVRHAQIAACLPMMQFSAAPWRVLDARHRDLCRDAARLHVELGPEIFALARHAAATGEPIVRPMAYHHAEPRFAGVTDQYLLGQDLLVAPALQPGQETREVLLPGGRWRDDRGETHEGGGAITADTPIDRIPRFRRADA